MFKSCKFAGSCVLAVVLAMSAQAPGQTRSLTGAAPTSQSEQDLAACREKIYSALSPTHMISPDGFRVTVPAKDTEAALGNGYKYDLAELREQATEFDKSHVSEEQAILAKLSDEQLTALFSDVAACTFKHRDELSRDDLVNYGIAMSEIASAREYRHIGHLLVTNDEERVKQYNALAAKYNELLKQCSH